MTHGGPSGCFLRQAFQATSVADLTVIEDEYQPEVIATIKAGSAQAIVDPLTSWAQALGYRRLWLPDNVIDIEVADGPKSYGTTCPTCHAEWSDDSPEFWQASVRQGSFPAFCWVCGGLMPQWQEWDHDAETTQVVQKASPTG